MAHLDFEKPLADLEDKIEALRRAGGQSGGTPRAEIEQLEQQVTRLRQEVFRGLTLWQKVQLSRHPDRPYFLDYAERIFSDILELHGDRSFRDDAAIISGFATFEGQSVAFIGQQKGRTSKQKVKRNFAMAHPEGYRKAMRVMQLAERFGRPVLTFIDTPGAYPGVGAEERGQSEAIGQSILLMSQLRVPSIATVIGEGGSGGALALGVASRVLMFEYATYSVITPEGCASILWRDGAKAPAAAEQLGMMAEDAQRLGIVDEVLPEPVGGNHADVEQSASTLRATLKRHLAEIRELDPDALRAQRYDKFRVMGAFQVGPDKP